MFFGNTDFSVKILSVHLLEWDARDTYIPPKRSYALSWRERGSSEFLMNGERCEASSGDILFFPKGIAYHISAGKERLIGINFEYEGELPKGIMKFSADNVSFFSSAFSEIYKIWTAREAGYYARAVSRFYRIIAEMVRENEEEKRDAIYTRLEPAILKIYKEYMDPGLSVGALSRHIGVSDTYFRRIFEKRIGKRPLDFINELRIAYAKEYLESGFHNIEKISELCGFSDAKYFSTVFKRYELLSPSEYIKKHT